MVARVQCAVFLDFAQFVKSLQLGIFAAQDVCIEVDIELARCTVIIEVHLMVDFRVCISLSYCFVHIINDAVKRHIGKYMISAFA